MRLDDKLAALDNHAARRMHVSEWQHLRTLAAAEGDTVIVAECDYRIAKLTARTRAQEAMRVVAQLRAALYEMTWCDFEITSGREAAVPALNAGVPRHRITIEITVNAPDEVAP